MFLVYHQNSSQVDIDEQMILISVSLYIDIKIDEQMSGSGLSRVFTTLVFTMFSLCKTA